MKRFVSPSSLSVCAAVILLAGCGGTQSPIGAPGAMPQSSKLAASDENYIPRSPVSNHVFAAAYSGQHTCHVGVGGKSFGSFLGKGTASVRGFRVKSYENIAYNPCFSGKGKFTLVGRPSMPHDTITGKISGQECSADTYKVTGGTGRYTGATGSGTVTFTCGKHKNYKDMWSGTISY